MKKCVAQPRRKHPRDKTLAALAAAIRGLPADKPVQTPGVWYLTQKQHWLGWLSEYDGPGAYGRKGTGRSAAFAYNHIVNPEMLLWLARASGVNRRLVKTATAAAAREHSMMSQSRAIRQAVPWSIIEQALWPERFPEPFTT